MNKDKSKDKFYFIQLNLLKDKHKELIKWIMEQADLNEQSLSAFCIMAIKRFKEEQEKIKE